MTSPSAAEADTEYERLAAQPTAPIVTRLAIRNRTIAARAALVQFVLENQIVRTYFSNRCVSVLCDEAASTEVAVACLASALGLDPNEDDIESIISHLVSHSRTLIVFESLDAIYSPTDPEQQEATDLLLTTLDAVDQVSLVITFGGPKLPECVDWKFLPMTYDTEDASEFQPQAANHPQHMTGSSATSSGVICETTSDRTASVAESKRVELPRASAQTRTGPRIIAHSKVPPPKPAVFHGRAKEVERLVAHSVVQSTAPIGIVGPGGIGKTTLALKVLHDPRVKQYFGKQRLFLTCEGESSVDDVLAQLANKLEVQRSQDGVLWPAVIEDLRSRQRVLLVLDNFESIWSSTSDELREAAEVLLAQLAVLDELTLLVTTRGNLLPESFTWANVDTAELDTLSSTAARLTFFDLSYLEPHVLELETEANALTELLREIDFVPLAITLLARLEDLPSRLLREWSEHYTAVLEADHHDGTRRELSVEVSIKISLAHLPAESDYIRPRQLLSVLGQLPAGLFTGVSTKLCSTIPNLDLAAQNLLHHSLAYSGGHGELRMLSPVRHYVSACLPMSGATLSVMDNIYLDIANTHPPDDRSDIDGPTYDIELPNLMSILSSTLDRRDDREMVQAIHSLDSYCYSRNYSSLTLIRKLLLHVNHPLDKATCLRSIGLQCKKVGQLDLGITSLERAADIYEEYKNKPGEAISRELLARLLEAHGQQKDADQQMARSQLLKEESSFFSDDEMLPGEDVVQAEQRLRNSREARLRAGDGIAVSGFSEGILKIVKKRGDVVAYTRELELVVTLGEQTRPVSTWLAQTKARLAQQYVENGDSEAAEELLVAAFSLHSQHDDRMGVASITYGLAALRASQLRFNEGAELGEAAAKLFREFGDVRFAKQCDQQASMLRILVAMRRR